MVLKNTAAQYGSIAKFLHWGIALLFVVAYASVYYRQLLTEPKTVANIVAFHIHSNAGYLVGILVVFRILWRIVNISPLEEPGSRLMHIAAHWGHYSLYAIMILCPLTGYMGAHIDTKFLVYFDVTRFADTAIFDPLVKNGLGMSFKEFEKPVDFVHKEILGAWIAWALVLGHAAAALYHHFVLKDRTLIKMTRS